MTTQPVSSSSSSSSSSSYDVFLSFRGDTRFNFADHLYKALRDKGINTFIDHRELVRGKEISPALVKAIEESRISLIVFSEKYASSRWCLDELVKILQCKQSKQQIVLPIFYKVDPSDVRKQTSKFGDAFEGLIKRKFKNDKEKVLIWREALTKVANLSGHTFKDGEYETTFINNIVDEILSRVPRRTYWNVAKHPVGIQSRVRDVERLLDVGGNDRRMVGIWGTSGIGKTTIAKAILNAVSHKFEGSCFLENVREESLVQLQKTLLHKYLGKKFKIQSVDEGIRDIKERLRHKKILLILDDVDQLEQLEKLAGDDWFGEGSRVIITTKNRRLLENREIELIYEVKKLDYNQALELFSWHAFRRSEPPEDYLELAQRAIAFADGLPLALTILGSHLRGIDIRRWQVTLDDYEGEPYTRIERILQKSYDALDDRAKGYFLDIACFFKGEYEDYVVQIVPPTFIDEFVDKAMITIEWSKISMHDLLEKLGKDIVHKESPNDPGKRSRLWFYEDVKQVLTESTGTRNIKGIVVKFPEPAEITLNPECFRNMINLQIFIDRNASLCGHINYLPNSLRWIDWGGYLLQSLPPNFLGELLVVFNMPYSHIRQLERFKHLPNLRCMNLSDCQSLEKIPDLSGIPNIEYLILSNCTSLVEVDDSIGFLRKLVALHLDGCINLTRFGTRLRLKSLGILDLSNCKRLESFPEIEVEMKSLQILNMKGSGIREFPLSIAYLTGLESLILGGCFNLTGLELRLFSCCSTLRKLDLSEYNFVTLPECISKFVSLHELHLSDCKSLLEIPQEVLPRRVSRLFMRNCTSLDKIPKLPLSSEVVNRELSLRNCVRLCCHDITENSILDQVADVTVDRGQRQGLLPDAMAVDDDIHDGQHQDNELLSFPSASETSLGKRPRSSDFMALDDDHEAQRGEANHPKRRHTDLNENSILDKVSSHPHSQFQIDLPGDEVPKWFSCTSLDKIPKLPLSSEVVNKELILTNCVRLCCHDITENSILDQVSSHPHSKFKITLPGDEVPKWFSCCKDAALVKDKWFARCEFCFEIPPNLDWETLILVLCFVNKGNSCVDKGAIYTRVRINRKLVPTITLMPDEGHVSLYCIPLLTWLQQSNTCKIIFEFVFVTTPVDILCGVHLLGHQVADVTVDRGHDDDGDVDDDDEQESLVIFSEPEPIVIRFYGNRGGPGGVEVVPPASGLPSFIRAQII